MRIKKSKLWVVCLTVIMSILINLVPVSATDTVLYFDEEITSYSSGFDFGNIGPFGCFLQHRGHCYVNYTAEDALQPGDVVNFKLYYRAYCDNHEGDNSWTDISDGYIVVYADNEQIGSIYVQDRGNETKEFTYVVPEGGAQDLMFDYCVDNGRSSHMCQLSILDFTINGNRVIANIN